MTKASSTIILKTAEAFAVSSIFVALFGKDILAQFLWGFENRNMYGAAFLIAGCLLCFLCILMRGELHRIFASLRIPLISGWVILLAIALFTSLYYRRSFYVSPHAVGFVSAVAVFLVSPPIVRKTLAAFLVIQSALLFYEFCFGVSLTPSINESLGYNLPIDGWIINAGANLVRAKGLLDSTHDSTWMYVYSSFVFPSAMLMFVVMPVAAWFALGRLGIFVSAALVMFGPRPLKAVVWIALIGATISIAAPDKINAGLRFVSGAFDPNSSSNKSRALATKDAIKYLAGQKTSLSTDYAANLLFGVSGLALVSGEVQTESSYTLFLIEYGILGLALMVWTVGLVLLDGLRRRRRANLVFAAMMAVIMASSSVQSASSFFLFWIAVFHLTPILPRATLDVAAGENATSFQKI